MKVLSDTRKLSPTTISVRTTNFLRGLHSAKLWHLIAKCLWHYLSYFGLWARLAVINSFSRKQICLTLGKQRYTRNCTSNLNVALQTRKTVATLFQDLTETSIFFLNGSSGHKQQTSHLQNPITLTKNLKPPTDSLVFQGTAMFGLLETATARFANSGEIMLFLGLVEVEFRLSVEPW